jgi:predicted nucleic acid-binding protein
VRHLVIDTNVYIDWLNARRHGDVLFQSGVATHLSAVVLMELSAGASPRDLRLIQRLESPFRKARRILLPSLAVFSEAGDVLRRLRVERDYDLAASHSIVNDVLIALSARSIGAAVASQNERDFRAIQSLRRFELLVVTGRSAGS